MKKTIVVFGSTTGMTEEVAGKIADKLGTQAINVSDFTADTIAENENLVLGSSTWGAGDLQDDWYDGVSLLQGSDLSGKTVAIFGVGDSEGYSDTFCGSMRAIYDAVEKAGAKVEGAVSTDGYTFDDSDSVIDGKFVGLALDETNEADKTDERIDAWVEEIKPEL